MTEEWRDIPGYEGLYSVSNLGRVRRDLGDGHAAKAGRILKPWRVRNTGYLAVTLSRENISRKFLLHRLVALVFLGTPQRGWQVNHKDGDKHNARVNNLEWVTGSDNALHAHTHGLQTMPRGDAHWNAKLSNADVAEIRRLSAYHRHTDLAHRYGVNRSTITAIVNGSERRFG